MPTLHLVHQGARLRIRSGRLLLTDRDGEELQSVPARKVRRVVVHGNVGLTTPAFVYLLKRGAEIAFISTDGRLYGLASSWPWPSPERIARQFSFSSSPRALQVAKEMVRAKLSSQLEYLRRRGVPASELGWGKELLRRVQHARGLDRLRGLEGLGSRLYFRTMALRHPNLGFEARRRRPPKDTVNAALSYAYAILLSVALSAVTHAGLHPEIGVLHATGRRRPSLALDLMEEFRVPVVDIPIFSAFFQGELKRTDALVAERGVMLTEQAKRVVISRVERRLASPSPRGVTYLELVFRQAERLGGAIVHGKAYQAFSLSGDRR